jgi:hypothetical protein
VTRVPERLSSTTETAVLEAERATAFAGGSVTDAHRAIVAARVAIDTERRRGDDWWKVSRLDWDADGHDEVHIELRDISMVIAPHRSAAATTVDCKRPVWPASAVSGEPGWVLCRYASDLDGLTPEPIALAEVRSTEARSGTVELELEGTIGTGSVSLDAHVKGVELRLRYRCNDVPTGRLGPELKLAFESTARYRVDGSEWQTITDVTAAAGHKFRITDGEHQVVLSTLTPCSVFLRPGIDGTGIVAWPHWAIDGSATLELVVDMRPPAPIAEN